MAQTELGHNKMIYIGLSGGVGGFLAILSDLVQKEEASAVMQINLAVRKFLGVTTYPLVVVLFLIAISVALCFIFSADSNKKAFYVGASILSIMMTAVPYNMPPSLNSQPIPAASGAVLRPNWWDKLMIPGPALAQNAQPANQTYSIHVHLDTTDKKPVESAIFTLIDPSSGQLVARSKVQGADFTFAVANRPYLLRVQVSGYAIAESSLNPAAQPSLTISLSPSSIPLSIQRIFRK